MSRSARVRARDSTRPQAQPELREYGPASRGHGRRRHGCRRARESDPLPARGLLPEFAVAVSRDDLAGVVVHVALSAPVVRRTTRWDHHRAKGSSRTSGKVHKSAARKPHFVRSRPRIRRPGPFEATRHDSHARRHSPGSSRSRASTRAGYLTRRGEYRAAGAPGRPWGPRRVRSVIPSLGTRRNPRIAR